MTDRLQILAPHMATSFSMGQQVAEQHLAKAIAQLDDIAFRPLSVTSMRSRLDADRRIPVRLAQQAPAWVQRALGTWAYRGADLVHRFDLRLPPGSPEVVTVHDAAPVRFADEGTLPRLVEPMLRLARAVIAPSRFAASEIADVFGLEHVHVIPNGVDPAAFAAASLDPVSRERLSLPPRFVLHTGGASRRKNLSALAEAWAVISREFPEVALVLCGPTDPRRTELFAPLPRTRLLGMVERPLLLSLMKSAAVLVVPSTYEGFGLPVLEALACHTRVVAADTSSLREVSGGHAALVEPTSAAIAAGVVGALRNETHNCPDCVSFAATFTWERAAASYRQLYLATL